MSISAEDKLEIQEVIIRMYQALDAHQADGYASYFATDGVSISPHGVFCGRNEIANFVERHIQQGNESGTLHCVANILVWEDAAHGPSISVEVMKFRVSDTPAVFLVSAFGTARMKKFETWQITRYELGHRPIATLAGY